MDLPALIARLRGRFFAICAVGVTALICLGLVGVSPAAAVEEPSFASAEPEPSAPASPTPTSTAPTPSAFVQAPLEDPSIPALPTPEPTGEPILGPPPTSKPVYGDKRGIYTHVKKKLKLLGYYGGRINPVYNKKFRKGLKRFQRKNGLLVTGYPNKKTRAAIKAAYKKKRAAIKAQVRAARIKARQRAKRSIAREHRRLDDRCLVGHVVCIDKRTRALRYVVNGKIVRKFSARFGAAATPTREGLFHVTFKSRDHVSSLYDSSMPFAMFFSGGQAVHYSSDFAATGYNGASHGCVNIRHYGGIAWLFDQVRVGDRVVVYWS